MPGNPQGQLVALDIDTIGRMAGSSAATPSYTQAQAAETNLTMLNAAGNGNGPSVAFGRSGDWIVSVSGTFNGASVKLQYLDTDGTTWVDAQNADNTTTAPLTSRGTFRRVEPSTSVARLVVSGGTTGVSITAVAAHISGI